jgi:hypothetical protein
MASHFSKADDEILRPGIVEGRHPDTGGLHRLTINGKGKVTIERKPYVSDNPDGWTQSYEPITDDALKTAAYLLQIGIEQYSQSPTLRRRTGIDLVDLDAATKIRRKLLKQIPK